MVQICTFVKRKISLLRMTEFCRIRQSDAFQSLLFVEFDKIQSSRPGLEVRRQAPFIPHAPCEYYRH